MAISSLITSTEELDLRARSELLIRPLFIVKPATRNIFQLQIEIDIEFKDKRLFISFAAT